jgi:beta-glucosidase
LIKSLPGKTNELIEAVLKVQPEAIVVVQSGMPVAMPWEPKVSTLLQVSPSNFVM